MKLSINKKSYEVDADPNMPILYVLRDIVGLTGTKFGCGLGQCGACTVHLNGQPIRSCLTPLSVVGKGELTTIEGLADGDDLHPIQQSWVEEKVAQCGYCQSGQIMSAAALLEQNKTPNEKEIEGSMQGNICRCGSYPRIKKAIVKAGKRMQEQA